MSKPNSDRRVTDLRTLLHAAHQDGLKRLETQIVLLPSPGDEDPLAIFRAEVETSKGTFQATGDATMKNTGRAIIPHLIRMAESRAIARALRWATNGAVAVEELRAPKAGLRSEYDDDFQPDEDSAGALKAAKLSLRRDVVKLRGDRDMSTDAWIVAVLRAHLDVERIEDMETLAELREAIGSGDYDLDDGSRIPDGV